jgi:F0F1-type ATP synthase assembly protein I
MYSMRQEELDNRSAELKARVLAQRNGHAQEKPSTVTERKSAKKANQDQGNVTVKASDGEDVNALRKRVAQLEAENKSLRKELAARNSRVTDPPRSSGDSVREQQHNFFKYSNARRY